LTGAKGNYVVKNAVSLCPPMPGVAVFVEQGVELQLVQTTNRAGCVVTSDPAIAPWVAGPRFLELCGIRRSASWVGWRWWTLIGLACRTLSGTCHPGRASPLIVRPVALDIVYPTAGRAPDVQGGGQLGGAGGVIHGARARHSRLTHRHRGHGRGHGIARAGSTLRCVGLLFLLPPGDHEHW